MTKQQVLEVAVVIVSTADSNFDGDEDKFEAEYGVTHAQVVNALPYLSALELLA